MSHLGYGRNEYGTLVSRHRCDVCDTEHTICPAQDDDEPCGYPPGLDPTWPEGCQSYDAGRDVARLLGDGAEVVMRPNTTASA
jgi:hypothetical protein